MKTKQNQLTQQEKPGKDGKRSFSPKTIRIAKVLLFASLGVLILWLITRNQDMNKVWDEFRQANFFWIILAFLSGVVSHIIRAIRWNLLISPLGYSPKLVITFYALMTGYLANLAVPRLGEITRCGTLAKHSKVPFNSLAGSVVAERIVDMITLLVLIFLTVLFQFGFLKGFLSKYIFLPFLDLLTGNLALLIILVIAGALGLIVFLKFIKGVSRNNTGFAGKMKRQILGFWKGVLSLAHIQNKTYFVFLSVLIWAFYFLTVYLVFFALPGTSSLGIADGFTILIMGSLGVVAPVPGGIGTYHFIVITTMVELLGVNAESATSYAYISHATQMVIVLLLGGFSWFMLSFNFRKDYLKTSK